MFKLAREAIAGDWEMISLNEGEFKLLLKYTLGRMKDIKPIEYIDGDKLCIFGDLHGCLDSLKKGIGKNKHNEYTYVFTGDVVVD